MYSTHGLTKELWIRPFRSQPLPTHATIHLDIVDVSRPLSNVILVLHPYGFGIAPTCSKVCARCYASRCPCSYLFQTNRCCGQCSGGFEAKVCCPEYPFMTSMSHKRPHPWQDPSVENPFSGVLHPGHCLRGSVTREHRRNCRRLPGRLSCFTHCTSPHGISKTLRSLSDVGQRGPS
jgi:hypothetical protein